MHRSKQRVSVRVIAAAVLVLSFTAQLLPMSAEAVFTQAFLRLDRMKINTATGGMICATPSAASSATENTVVVTFPSTYTVNTTAANWTVSTTNILAGATAWPSIATATSANNGTKAVTFPSGDLTAGTQYCFNFASVNTLTTAASAANNQQANIETFTSAPATIDKTFIALANNTDDTIVVTAVVPPTFIFTLSGYADTFTGNLDPTVGAGGIVSTSGVTATVTTNAKGGWIAWARDSQQGLRSTVANYTIPTVGTVNGAPSTINGGTEGYVLDVDLTTDATGGCTLAIDAEYNGTSTAMGGTLSANYQPIAACTGTVPATANGDVITMIERATISGATPAAADYTDSITVVGAGNF